MRLFLYKFWTSSGKLHSDAINSSETKLNSLNQFMRKSSANLFAVDDSDKVDLNVCLTSMKNYKRTTQIEHRMCTAHAPPSHILTYTVTNTNGVVEKCDLWSGWIIQMTNHLFSFFFFILIIISLSVALTYCASIDFALVCVVLQKNEILERQNSMPYYVFNSILLSHKI